MKKATRDFINSLADIRWFSNVGTPLDSMARARQVQTWSEAARLCSHDKWEKIRIDAANEMREQLPVDQLNQWNTVVNQVKEDVEPLIEEIVFSAVPAKCREDIHLAAGWDVVHAAMEHEYNLYLNTQFYRHAMLFYEAGHFPCSIELIGHELVTVYL